MKILFKWENKTYGRIERKDLFSPNEVIGSIHRIKGGKLVVVINFDNDYTTGFVSETATAAKQKVQQRLNDYANEKVTVYSIFDLKQEKPIEIRRGDRGGVCDPSTEQYHTM